MGITYWISEGGWVAFRVDGDPMSDGFFVPSKPLDTWLAEKKAMGARITYLSPPREETWGGPHFGRADKVKVIAVVELD